MLKIKTHDYKAFVYNRIFETYILMGAILSLFEGNSSKSSTTIDDLENRKSFQNKPEKIAEEDQDISKLDIDCCKKQNIRDVKNENNTVTDNIESIDQELDQDEDQKIKFSKVSKSESLNNYIEKTESEPSENISENIINSITNPEEEIETIKKETTNLSQETAEKVELQNLESKNENQKEETLETELIKEDANNILIGFDAHEILDDDRQDPTCCVFEITEQWKQENLENKDVGSSININTKEEIKMEEKDEELKLDHELKENENINENQTTEIEGSSDNLENIQKINSEEIRVEIRKETFSPENQPLHREIIVEAQPEQKSNVNLVNEDQKQEDN